MSDKQRTIREEITLTGKGLHTGGQTTLSIKPAPVGTGILFRRIDIKGKPEIEAHITNVISTDRGTSIAKNDVFVHTTEHLLAAMTGMQIDNAIIDLDNEETPILDGSARFYTEALEKAGTIEQEALREYIELNEIISYEHPQRKTEMMLIPDNKYQLTVMIDFETEVLSTQNAELKNIADFNTEISKCRTFVFLHELEFLLQNNLIKGGDIRNAIIFVNRVISQEELDKLADLFKQPKVKVLNKGILNNIQLYFENEPARHKMLDVIGDLRLLGKPLRGHVIAKRPGHLTNIEFAKLIYAKMKEKENARFLPPFDIYKKPIYDVNDIKNFIPHRPPFLLIDKILDMDEQYVMGLKNVTMNESFFVGHFPDEPVMPGVLQIEAMAQTGGIFVLNTVDNPTDYLTYFLKIDNVKFRNKVVPGDTLVFILELMSPIRRGLGHMKGIGYVANKPVIEAEILAQIAKKPQ